MTGRIRVAVFTAALVTAAATAFAPAASAEDAPTSRELLDLCDNGTDLCAFHPDGPPQEFMGDAHQVGDSAFNCTGDTQRTTIGWSDTTGESNSLGVSLSAEYGFSEVFKVTIETSYQHTWESSHTDSQQTNVDVRAGEVGWVERAPQMQHVSGQYELHFGSPYKGHYYWYVPFDATGPLPDAPSTVTQKTRPMTDQEHSEHCG